MAKCYIVGSQSSFVKPDASAMNLIIWCESQMGTERMLREP
jgi:hypothetical protein